MTQSDMEKARSQLTQLFRYVQAFNQLQNPVEQDIKNQPWTLWLSNLPAHPCISCKIATNVGDTGTSSSNKQAERSEMADDSLLKVKRPTLTEAPRPPREIAPYIQDGWQDIEKKVVLDPKYWKDFNDDTNKRQLFQQWIIVREQWVKKEQPAYKVMDIFERLFELYAQLKRESERLELMLGDGLIDWSPPGSKNSMYHPLLLLQLQLRFDSRISEFTLVATETPELYTALLRSFPEVDSANLADIRQQFENNAVYPSGGYETSQFLRQLVCQLSPRGKFSDRAIERSFSPFPIITRNPVIFLRKRVLGYNTALESILDDLSQRESFSYPLLSLTGINVSHQQQSESGNAGEQASSFSLLSSPNGEDEHILFSKPANAEQLKVAKRLEQHGAVLVQGPPGTGKTHTIANLLGHLLAQGKSVLVTSHTSKALKVLREKVVEPLQPLCVSILEGESRKEMERAIDAISERFSSISVDKLEREANWLAQRRLDLLAELRAVRGQLKEARQSEYRDIVLDGKAYDPSAAARYIAQSRATHNWIPGPVDPETPLPLSLQELASLYQTNARVTVLDEREMSGGLPDPQTLASPVDFEQWTKIRANLLQNDLEFGRHWWATTPENPSIDILEQLVQRLLQATALLKDACSGSGWKLAAITAGRDGGAARQVWDDLIAKIEQTGRQAVEAQPLLLEYDPQLPENYLTVETEHLLVEILRHFKQGKRLTKMTLFIHRPWNALIEHVQVKGQRPVTEEHFQALYVQLRLTTARRELVRRWQKQMTILGAADVTDLGSAPERVCQQYVFQLRQCLDWFGNTWTPLEQELRSCGLQWDAVLATMPVNLTEHGDLQRLYSVVQKQIPSLLVAEANRRRYRQNEACFFHLLRFLESGYITRDHQQTEVVQHLYSAIRNYDADAYRQAFLHLVDLYEKQHALRLRQELLRKLEPHAPAWAAAIRNREGVHGNAELPGDPQEAWYWLRLHTVLEQRSTASLEALQERSVQLSDRLHTVTAELVEKRAWAAQVRRTTVEQRRALQGWKELMRKVGKGTGKRAPQLLAEARRLMPLCQSAVPVWIMPLSHVVQNFNPKQNRFDVVVIDEASQADIKALAALYLGEQIVIVGDDEQVTPIDVGQDLEQVNKLIDEHLQGIPLAKLYDGRTSIYALARTTFEPVCLQEHFRCVSPIIQFSNMLSYDGKIKPLRDDSAVRRRPATIAYSVRAFEATGSINEPEAWAITSLLKAAIEQPEYHDATFGVISMVKDQQALYIDKLLRKNLDPTQYTSHQILCGNPAHFQGDERDVIFISMVDVPRGNGPLPLRSEDANEYMYKKRFNVAASRARDQLWVVHSLDPHIDLKDGDIRKRLILHAQNPVQGTLALAEQEKKVESEFERQVLQRLMQAGYRVIPQWPVGAYRIDLVVEGDGKRLAIECDGDRWHPLEKLEEDMARQAILERLGWRFVRIRGSHFFRAPEQALAPVFARLNELAIPPIGTGTVEQALPRNEEELRERVVRRAAELRKQWEISAKQPADAKAERL